MSTLSVIQEAVNALPHWPLYAFAAMAGAALTSFGCLAVDRLPHQLGWRDDPQPNLTLHSPPSRCDVCKTRIKWMYLIPIIGYVLARGRCSACGVRVPMIYPALELVGAAGTCGMLAMFGITTGAGIAAALLWLVLLFLAWMDWNEQWLPAVVTQPLLYIGALFSPFAANADDRIAGWIGGCVLMWLAMKAISILRKNDLIAGGDIALSGAAGAWLGWQGLPLFLFLSSVCFIVYATPLRRKGQMFVPMGPALALGWMISLLILPAWLKVLQQGLAF